MPSKSSIIYICGGDVSVYESQVLELLAYYQHCDVEIALIQGYHDAREKSQLERKLSNYSTIPVVWHKSYPCYDHYRNRTIRSLYKALISVPNFNNSVIHARSEYNGYLLTEIVKRYKITNPILIDIRGVVLEEIKYRISNTTGFRRVLQTIQRYQFKKCYQHFFNSNYPSICVSAVSPRILDYIRVGYPLCNYKLSFHPNIAGHNFVYSDGLRRAIRSEYGLAEDDIVAICATGGNSAWQKDYCVIQHLLDMGIKVINLSKTNYGIEGCITTTVPFSKMAAMLSAADIAVLWRENTFINQSASPSKFSEFAAMGLYVIHNGSVQVATDYINQSKWGCIVENVEDIPMSIIDDVRQSDREHWVAEGRKHFGIENIGRSYLNQLGLL